MAAPEQTRGKFRTVRARAVAGTAVTVALLLAATGCSSGDSSKSTAAAPAAGLSEAGVGAAATSAAAAGPAEVAGSSAQVGAPAAATSAAAAAATSGSATSGSDTSGATSSNAPLEGRPGFQSDPQAGRSVIYTASVDVQVAKPADVTRAADEAANEASLAGGYVFSRDGQAADSGLTTVPQGETPAPGGVAEADLTIKVPPGDAYDSLLNKLDDGLGTLLSIDERSQDVTDQVVDTSARLSTMQASVARVRTLLAKATTIGQIVEVEGELTKREADLESLEGQLNVLKSQTALATINLHLQSATPATVVPPVVKPKPGRPIHGFVGGLKAGGRGFATVAIAIATVLGATLPFVGTLLVVLVIAWFARRQWLASRRAGAAKQATP